MLKNINELDKKKMAVIPSSMLFYFINYQFDQMIRLEKKGIGSSLILIKR
jgi:hypothetical protein